MSNDHPPASSPLEALVTARRQAAVGLAVAGVVLAILAVLWGTWGFARSGSDATPPEGKFQIEQPDQAGDKKADESGPKKSPDYQIACIWAAGLALVTLAGAAWLYTQPADP